MAEDSGTLREAHRKAWGAGLAVSLVLPLAVAALGAVGVLPPGRNPVVGLAQQAGYTFTGLVFLAATGMAWRRGRALGAFGRLSASWQVQVLRREARIFTALSALSTVCAGLYWSLVGWNAVRHTLTFLLLTPVMFLCFMPGRSAWDRARKEVP